MSQHPAKPAADDSFVQRVAVRLEMVSECSMDAINDWRLRLGMIHHLSDPATATQRHAPPKNTRRLSVQRGACVDVQLGIQVYKKTALFTIMKKPRMRDGRHEG